ncbi:ABC transporter permease [Roseivirga sp.]|uniref:ABC transporter permease n=1 Tax=Roseivirga sp. TaxID=1964215 RepID=UPI003B51BBA4
MLKNYFKTTLRSFRKNKSFALINILGLSVGIAASIFILQYAFFHLSFDQFHGQSDRIFRVMNERFEGDQLIQRGQITYSAVGPQMKEDFPEIVNQTTLNFFVDNVFVYDNHPVEIPSLFLAEPTFFEMFDFELLAGSDEDLLGQPNQVVFTRSYAEKVFQTTEGNWNDYLGEIVELGASQREFQLVGILADPPNQSSLQFEAILSRSTLFTLWGESARFGWQSSDYFHYVQLADGVDYKEFQKKFDAFSDQHFRGDEVTGTIEKFHLQPLEDVHLYSDYEYENHHTFNGKMVWVLVIIAVFILVMAWVNYVNLTTSRSIQRAKEVGVRKVVGATRVQLINQYLTESLVLNLVAFVLAITLVQILQSEFNNLVEEPLSLISFASTSLGGIPLAVWAVIVVLVGTLCSGLYPAFALSSYKPSQTLKGEFSTSAQGRILRKSLVTFQFILSTALIAGTYLVMKQTQYMQNQDIGANLEQVITVEGPSLTNLDTTFVTHIHAFINQLEQNPRILKAGASANVFGSRLPRVFNVKRPGETDGHMLNRMSANYGFLDVYEIELLAGRNFRPGDHNKDPQFIDKTIINEKAARILGFANAEEALNKKILFFNQEWTIVGITTDFHQRSLKDEIEPLILLPFYDGGEDTYHIRVSTDDLPETMAYIETTFDEFFPGDLFEYGFMNDRYGQLYKSDVQFGKVFNLFSLLAISIACLGLFGLVGYTAIQRTKEIGIRKVLGASIADILQMLSKEFLVLILLANVIGLPLIYLAAQSWLNGYAYQTSIGLFFFALPVLIVAIISVSIIVVQTMKVARINPVNSLRQE